MAPWAGGQGPRGQAPRGQGPAEGAERPGADRGAARGPRVGESLGPRKLHQKVYRKLPRQSPRASSRKLPEIATVPRGCLEITLENYLRARGPFGNYIGNYLCARGTAWVNVAEVNCNANHPQQLHRKSQAEVNYNNTCLNVCIDKYLRGNVRGGNLPGKIPGKLHRPLMLYVNYFVIYLGQCYRR